MNNSGGFFGCCAFHPMILLSYYFTLRALDGIVPKCIWSIVTCTGQPHMCYKMSTF